MPRTITALALALSAGAASAQQSFELLGTLPGTSIVSEARGVSDDGSTVCGWSGSSFYYGASPHGFRWSHSSGIQDIDPLSPECSTWAISGDGQTIVGMEASTGSTHAYRWISIGPDTLYHGGEAEGVSHDGSVIGGFEFSGGSGSTIRRATRWSTEHSGAQLIDDPNTSTSSQTMGVSADGATLVGFAQFTGLGMRAFRWTAASGMVNIGSSSGSGPTSQALSVSGDGSVIVGYTTSPTGVQRAVAWTPTGTIDLASLIGAPFSIAYAVSADGSTIVGTSGPNSVGSHRGFIWTAQTGVRDLNTVLAGVMPAGWTILEAHAVSADGRFVAGSAGGGTIAKEAFLANVSTPTCYANCDHSTDAPALNVNDFICFQAAFAAGDSYANCDQSSTPPVLNVNDFICFQARFAAGCS